MKSKGNSHHLPHFFLSSSSVLILEVWRPLGQPSETDLFGFGRTL